MCFTTVSSFIYYNDFIYYNNNKFIWAMTQFCSNNFVNLWCMHWLYFVYKIPAYDILNSYSVIMQVNIPICDIFDIRYDYYDVNHNFYTVPEI